METSALHNFCAPCHRLSRTTLYSTGCSLFVYVSICLFRNKLYKKIGDDAQLQQFKCVEFVEELIYGEWRAKQFINNIFLSIAQFISRDVFPTPEKTIFFTLIPALTDFNNSPEDTTSAPDPIFFNSLSIFNTLFYFLVLVFQYLLFS